jgi:hypothetical protein
MLNLAIVQKNCLGGREPKLAGDLDAVLRRVEFTSQDVEPLGRL